jgi:hypothetical protein
MINSLLLYIFNACYGLIANGPKRGQRGARVVAEKLEHPSSLREGLHAP